MNYTILPYHPSHLPALYRICLLTGDSGRDASALFHDPDLLGHYYVGPYALLEPDTCFTLAAQDGQPCGYILGARDSLDFARRCEQAWFPELRQRYPMPSPDETGMDADLRRMIQRGRRTEHVPAAYPAHLHIDLLPQAQGQGWGKRLMAAFLERLATLDVPGVHLGVDPANQAALAFYQRLGFTPLEELAEVVWMGKVLRDGTV